MTLESGDNKFNSTLNFESLQDEELLQVKVREPTTPAIKAKTGKYQTTGKKKKPPRRTGTMTINESLNAVLLAENVNLTNLTI